VQLKLDDLMSRPAPGPKAYSVTQLVQQASRLVETHFGDLWVEGEVSNYRQPSSVTSTSR